MLYIILFGQNSAIYEGWWREHCLINKVTPPRGAWVYMATWGIGVKWVFGTVCIFRTVCHRENSPITQTSPEPTLLSWGGGPCEKFFPHPLATRQAQSCHANWATQTLLFSKPLDLAQVCHGNKICSKPALTWKMTLVLAFPAHCMSN